MSVSGALTVTLAPVPEADGRQVITGTMREDTWALLTLRLETRDATEALGLVTRIEGLPPGALLSEGTTESRGAWTLPRAALLEGRLALRPPPDSDATLHLTLRTEVIDTSATGAQHRRPISARVALPVARGADAPLVMARDAAGEGDRAIALDLAAQLTDLDGSETLSLRLIGVPAGASLSAGRRDADGSWRLAPQELSGLSLTPPRDFSGDIMLRLAATATERGGGGSATTRDVTVHVAPVADAARITDAGRGRARCWRRGSSRSCRRATATTTST